MKNAIKILGIIAIVAVIGFSMAACDNGNGGGGGPTVTISGTPKVGQKLTASSKGDGFEGNYMWSGSEDKNATIWPMITSGLSGENNSELTLGDWAEGYYISVMRANSNAGAAETYVGPVTK